MSLRDLVVERPACNCSPFRCSRRLKGDVSCHYCVGGEKRRKRKRPTIFLGRTRKGHRYADEHWNCFKSNVGKTSESPWRAYTDFSERKDTTLSCTRHLSPQIKRHVVHDVPSAPRQRLEDSNHQCHWSHVLVSADLGLPHCSLGHGLYSSTLNGPRVMVFISSTLNGPRVMVFILALWMDPWSMNFILALWLDLGSVSLF